MKILLSILMVAVFTSTSFSQEEVAVSSKRLLLPNSEAGFGLQFIIPTGSFQNNTGSIPVGLSGHYYHKIGSKFMLGAELSSACMSHAEYEIDLGNGEKGTLYEDENMWGIMIGGRFNFIGNSSFRSYTEVRAGANTFYTSISSCDKTLAEYAKEETHGTSFVTSLGIGLVMDPKAILKGEEGKVWMTLRGAFVAGTNVDYRHAPESGTPSPINSNIYNSSLSYFEIGWSASWQFNK